MMITDLTVSKEIDKCKHSLLSYWYWADMWYNRYRWNQYLFFDSQRSSPLGLARNLYGHTNPWSLDYWIPRRSARLQTTSCSELPSLAPSFEFPPIVAFPRGTHRHNSYFSSSGISFVVYVDLFLGRPTPRCREYFGLSPRQKGYLMDLAKL